MGLEKLVAGDTLDFPDDIPDYLPADGWTLKYRLTPLFTTPTQAPITLTASTYEVTKYRIQATPDQTAAWSAGTYSWARWVEKTGARQTLDPLTPFLAVTADPSYTVQGYDPRSHARKMVDLLEAALLSYTTSGGHVAEYEIAGRRMKYASKAEIVTDISYWKSMLWKEGAIASMAAGNPNPRNIGIRFGRA